jgi:DNA-binding NtrC family response regulator
MDSNRRTGKDRTILVVDDDEAIRAWLERLLTEAGYRVASALSVEQGKKLLASEEPDLLITDVRMGAFNGLHLLALSPASLPKIVITGHDDPVVENDARRLGATFLLKPVSPSELLRLVETKLA